MIPRPSRRTVIATAAAAILPAMLGWLVFAAYPQGCGTRVGTAIAQWACLMPGLMISVSWIVALLLPLGLMLNRRLGHLAPPRWFVIVPLAGGLTFIVLTTIYAILLGPAYFEIFAGEILTLPQPLLAGAIPAAIYCAVKSRLEPAPPR